MTGGSLPYADIALNIASALRLKGRCKVSNSDPKVGISDIGPFIYPKRSGLKILSASPARKPVPLILVP